MTLPTVTVSIPCWRSPKTIRRAVAAVLSQTHRGLLCVVVNDGDRAQPPWPYLQDIDDPRLIRHDLAANRGRYHADAVTLHTCKTRWWTVHDSDDAADRRWLEVMIKTAEADNTQVVQTAQTVKSLRGQYVHEPVEHGERPARALHHYAHMAGLWDTQWLRTVGGPNPAFRLGYDTLLSTIARYYANVSIIDEPLYTRFRRRGSLSTSKHTGGRSPQRTQAQQQLHQLWKQLRYCRTPAEVGTLVRKRDRISWTRAREDAHQLAPKIGKAIDALRH